VALAKHRDARDFTTRITIVKEMIIWNHPNRKPYAPVCGPQRPFGETVEAVSRKVDILPPHRPLEEPAASYGRSPGVLGVRSTRQFSYSNTAEGLENRISGNIPDIPFSGNPVVDVEFPVLWDMFSV